MKKYEEPKLDIVSVNTLDIMRTSGEENLLDNPDVYAGSTDYVWIMDKN